jgi:hypothetical protein
MGKGGSEADKKRVLRLSFPSPPRHLRDYNLTSLLRPPSARASHNRISGTSQLQHGDIEEQGRSGQDAATGPVDIMGDGCDASEARERARHVTTSQRVNGANTHFATSAYFSSQQITRTRAAGLQQSSRQGPFDTQGSGDQQANGGGRSVWA